MEDVRLGRETGSSQNQVTITTSSKLLLEADDLRTAIVISAPQFDGMVISFKPLGANANGILLPLGGSPLILDLQHHGNLVTRAIYAALVTPAAADELIVVWFSRLTRK